MPLPTRSAGSRALPFAIAAIAIAAPLAACHSGGAGASDEAPRAATVPAVDVALREATVRDILGRTAHVGELVRVAGHCVAVGGQGSESRVGEPPVSPTDWLLASDGVSVFVTGAPPASCGSLERGADSVTIVARVAEDTLPTAEGIPAAPRRYLVLMDGAGGTPGR
jgi:hypothetical protein